MIGAEVERESLFSLVKEGFLSQSREGLLSMGQAVVDSAYESMPVADGPASAGKPPHSHTETLRNALAFAVKDGYLYVGTLFSKVGVRGAVLEYGGRNAPVMSRAKSRRSRTASGALKRYKPHPFITPAYNATLDTFSQRVAKPESFVPPSAENFTS